MSPEHGLLVVIYNVDGASRIKKSYTTDTSNGPSSSLADINLGLTGVVGHIEIKAPSDGAGRELTRLPTPSLRPPLPPVTSLSALLHRLFSFPSAFPASFLRRMLGPLTDHAMGALQQRLALQSRRRHLRWTHTRLASARTEESPFDGQRQRLEAWMAPSSSLRTSSGTLIIHSKYAHVTRQIVPHQSRWQSKNVV